MKTLLLLLHPIISNLHSPQKTIIHTLINTVSSKVDEKKHSSPSHSVSPKNPLLVVTPLAFLNFYNIITLLNFQILILIIHKFQFHFLSVLYIFFFFFFFFFFKKFFFLF